MLNAVICRFGSAVMSGVTLMLFASVMWLKLMSYVHINYDMRSLSKSSDKGGLSSTHRITLRVWHTSWWLQLCVIRCCIMALSPDSDGEERHHALIPVYKMEFGSCKALEFLTLKMFRACLTTRNFWLKSLLEAKCFFSFLFLSRSFLKWEIWLSS